jgi:hypothetical protein
MIMDDAIHGEKFMNMCDVYIGEKWNFDRLGSYAPYKCIHLSKLVDEWENPKLVFCFLDCVYKLQGKVHLLKNPFVLVSHIQDMSITSIYSKLLASPKVLHWFSQNTEIEHSKLTNLPIGIPHPFWHPVGQIIFWEKVEARPVEHKSEIFFGFGLETGFRQKIKELLLGKGLEWGFIPYDSYPDYLNKLANKTKYCICPEGWGKDCFRTWESFYTNVYPIAIRCPVTEKIAKEYPMILLNSWDEFDKDAIPEPAVKFSDEVTQKLKFSYYQKIILDTCEKVFNERNFKEFYKHCK